MTNQRTLEQKIKSYVGGIMEIQNRAEGYLYRGSIKSISIENEYLNVEFSSLKKGVGYPPIPSKWVEDGQRNYSASLSIYSVSDIGNGRTGLQSAITDELAVLFPKNMAEK